MNLPILIVALGLLIIGIGLVFIVRHFDQERTKREILERHRARMELRKARAVRRAVRSQLTGLPPEVWR